MCIEKYKHQNKSAYLLFDFVNTDLSKEEFLKKENENNNLTSSNLKLATDLTDRELQHEYCHVIEWAKRNIRSNIYRVISNSFPVTIPNEEDFKKYAFDIKTTKKDLLNLYKDVASAPEKHRITLDGSDKLYREIILKKIKSKKEIDNYINNLL